MKKSLKLVCVAVVLSATQISAKVNADVKSLNDTLTDYKKVILSGDLTKTIDYMYPGMFKMVPKEKLVQQFKTMQDSKMFPKITEMKILKVSDEKTFSKGKYAIADYSQKTEMDLKALMSISPNGKKNLDDPAKFKEFKTYMIQNLKSSLGSDAKITTTEGSAEIKIENTSKFIAINENKSGWKFLEISKKTYPLLNMVLPKDLIEKEKALLTAPTK